MGARKAFQEHPDPNERERWLSLPFTGIDGLPTEGQAWVNEGLLTATVVSGTTTRVERTLIDLSSYPSLDRLSEIGAQRRAK